MHPHGNRDLSLFGELDHVHRRRVSPSLARSAFQRRLKFPDRRIARTPDRIERDAGFGFAAGAFDLQPAISSVEHCAGDGWAGPPKPSICSDQSSHSGLFTEELYILDHR
jgi:hypothetical protein